MAARHRAGRRDGGRDRGCDRRLRVGHRRPPRPRRATCRTPRSSWCPRSGFYWRGSPGIGLVGVCRHRSRTSICVSTTAARVDPTCARFAGRIAASVATLGSGGAMGFEGPSIYIGSSIGASVQARFQRFFSRADRRVLLVGGCGRGCGGDLQGAGHRRCLRPRGAVPGGQRRACSTPGPGGRSDVVPHLHRVQGHGSNSSRSSGIQDSMLAICSVRLRLVCFAVSVPACSPRLSRAPSSMRVPGYVSSLVVRA